MSSKFSISPMSQKIELKAGETYEGSIIIAVPKDATENFRFKVSVSPYSVKGTGYTPDFETMSDWSRITEWITLETESGELAPNESKKIKFKVKVPENAPAGGQYAMIGVSSDNQISAEAGGVHDAFEMASLIFANVEGETRHGGRILENQIPGFVASGKPVVSTTIINEGNVHETAKVEVKVKNNITGEVIYPKDNESTTLETIVMPESTRVFTRELDGLPLLGIFEVTENVEYMDTEMGTTVVMMICPIWFMVLVFATIASIVGLIIFGHFKHRKRKLALLGEPEE